MSESNQYTPFKIIALTPREGCKVEYLKVLQIGHPYYFYRNFKLGDKEQLIDEPYLKNLFNPKDPHVEVTAIVGKNGSGKSTIMELLFMTINNLTCQNKSIRRDLVYIDQIYLDMYFLSNAFYKIKIRGNETTVYAYDDHEGKMVAVQKMDFHDLFYTVAVNYSHYAYNNLDYPRGQKWLKGVFHKNDAYQIPIVLNPYRDDGNININRENQLVAARIMANLLRPSSDKDFDFRKLSAKFRAVRLRLKLDRSKEKKVLYERTVPQKTEISKQRPDGTYYEEVTIGVLMEKIPRAHILQLLNKEYPFSHHFDLEQEEPAAYAYIFYKLVSICLKYDDYKDYFSEKEERFNHVEKYIQEVIGDPSHISFKLKQTLNYLKYKHVRLTDKTLELDDFGEKVYKIYGNKNNKHIKELIELIPPPIFSPEIMMKEIKGRRVTSFKYLSSGEKQMNYSVSSLLYHLNNLDSIPDEDRIQYRNVFAVMEEIELYFHPEMQREYVDYIVKSIVQLKLKRVKNIHICFVTHSPFILSDLPESNILFLDEEGWPAREEAITATFGGNIHELLAKSFFLKDALIGEFAKGKIKWLIDRLKEPQNKNEIARIDQQEIMDLINIIGEEFIREKLREMYYERFDITRDEKIKQLEIQIQMLKDAQTKNQQNNGG
ncbi:MAG TPA: AAA family ATPase [Mucilaginibacter sp.]|nr:AAA family ATPase [Mucilaginibacter sp.]